MKTLCVTLLALNWLILVASSSETHEAGDVSDELKMVQSPIAISMRDSTVEDDLPALEFFGHWDSVGNATLINSGHSAIVKLERAEQPYITGGPLKAGEKYIFEQMHFHWAKRDKYGSEHVVDGQTRSMEAHLVHYNEKYGDFNSAISHKDGVAVVAFFMQAFGSKKDENLAKITNYIKKVREPGATYPIDSDCLKFLASQELSRHYYSYHGSLTTPPYNECVTWIIFQAPIFVSHGQVEVFRHIREPHHHMEIGGNSRPVQKPEEDAGVIFARNLEDESEE